MAAGVNRGRYTTSTVLVESMGSVYEQRATPNSSCGQAMGSPVVTKLSGSSGSVR